MVRNLQFGESNKQPYWCMRCVHAAYALPSAFRIGQPALTIGRTGLMMMHLGGDRDAIYLFGEPVQYYSLQTSDVGRQPSFPQPKLLQREEPAAAPHRRDRLPGVQDWVKDTSISFLQEGAEAIVPHVTRHHNRVNSACNCS